MSDVLELVDVDESVVVEEFDNTTVARSFLMQMGIAELLDGPYTEVAINRPREIWTLGKQGWTRHDAPKCTYSACDKLANALVVLKGGGLKLSSHSPYHAVLLPDGQRGHVLRPPACEAGTISITIRIPSDVRFTLDDYVNTGRFKDFRDKSPRVAIPEGIDLEPFQLEIIEAKNARDVKRVIELAVEHRLNIVVGGGTNSGKTTLSKAMSDLVSSRERIGTIEDTPEMSLPGHPNHVRQFFGDNLSAKECVKNTLRMNFDRVYLGEVRGDETWDYFTLLNTGKSGGMTTVHCNSSREAIPRIATLIKQSQVGQSLDWKFVLDQVAMTVDLVLYMKDTYLTEVLYDPVRK
jgi:type IV secretion system protein VirB11